MKVAVIGTGAMGRNHARVYADLQNVTLVGVCDANMAAAEGVAWRHRCKAFRSVEELISEAKPDAVSICVPTAQHVEVARQVLARRIPALLEKPIADSVEQGEELIHMAESAGVCLMIGHIERFNPAVLALRERLGAGELGQVFQIDARRQGPFPSRITDVGVIIDLAVHDLDVIRFVTGKEFVRMFAETSRRVHSTHEDLLMAVTRLGDGTIASLAINWLTPTKIRSLTVTGERGMFQVDYLTQDLTFYENATARAGDWEEMQRLSGVTEGKMVRHVVPKKEPLRVELEAFIRCLVEGKPPPVSASDGLRALALAKRLGESARTGQVSVT